MESNVIHPNPPLWDIAANEKEALRKHESTLYEKNTQYTQVTIVFVPYIPAAATKPIMKNGTNAEITWMSPSATKRDKKRFNVNHTNRRNCGFK